MLRSALALSLCLASTFASVARAQVDVQWTDAIENTVRGLRTAIAPSGTIYTLAGFVPSATPSHWALVIHTPSGASSNVVTWSFAGDPVTMTSLAIEPSSGDAYVVGHSQRVVGGTPVPGSENIVVARFRADGTKAWERSWDGPSSSLDYGYDVALDANGRVIVSGTTWQGTIGSLVVLAYDANGGTLWSTVVAETATTAARLGLQVDVAPNGDVVSAGVGAFPNRWIAVTWLDAAGNSLRTRYADTVPSSLGSTCRALAIDSASNVYVGGWYAISGGPGAVLAKFRANGDFAWLRGTSDLGGAREIRDLAIDANDRVIACGVSRTSTGAQDAVVVALRPSGSTIWDRTWSSAGAEDDAYEALDVDAQGGVVVVGTARDQTFAGSLDPLVVRYDADGELRWIHTGVSQEHVFEDAFDVVSLPDGTITYVGSINPPMIVTRGVMVVRLREQGVPFCFGDGGATACPCGNASAVGEGAGCRNSFGGGARLVDLGDASVANDTLVLRASALTNSAVLFGQANARANGGAGVVFGDGLLCIAGGIVRLGTEASSGGVATHPPAGGTPVSVRGLAQPGTTLHYQALYRDLASFCTPAAFNQTNGLSIAWGT